MRGRLSVSDTAFTAYLPGTICRGGTEPRLSLECLDSQDPWLLAPGAIARFAPDRNLFQGHIDIEPGGVRELPPFYSAAPAGDGWIFAGADGRAHVYSRSWEPAGAIDQWGSDIAAIQTPCGARILATRATGIAEPDAIQPYELVRRRRAQSRRSGAGILRTHYRAVVRRQLRHGGFARSPNRTLCGFQPGSHLRFLARSARVRRGDAPALRRDAARRDARRSGSPRPGRRTPPRWPRWFSRPLVRLDAAGAPQPCLAVSWQHDAAAKRWQFNLRPGVKLHDGSPLTAGAVAASLQAALPGTDGCRQPATPSPSAPNHPMPGPAARPGAQRLGWHNGPLSA